jgi:ADP-heptose:LPS heptosyltransferase
MPKKILILRFSSIGDIVLTTPVIRCLKNQLEHAEIHYATKKQYASILSANPYIHKVHVLDDSLIGLVKQLRQEKFDFIVDLHHNLRTLLIKQLLAVPAKSFNKLNIEKWLFVNFKINKLPPVHIVDRYLKTVETLGVKNDGLGLDYFIPPGEVIPVSSLPLNFRSGYVCVVAGAMHNTKKLTLQKINELIQKIKLPVVIIGGKDDYPNTESSEHVYNACGKYTINESASIIQQAEKVYTHDTGMMHIAAAMQKDIVSIWGNTVPEFGMYPYYGNQITLHMLRERNQIIEICGLPCRPCSKIGYERCPKGHFKCIVSIDFDKYAV